MIAISAYTEPIPVDAIVSEPPQLHENEETESKSGFAELLAGLLQTQSVNNSSDDSFDALAVEKTQDGNKLNIFANVIEGGIDLDSSDIELSDTDIKNLISAEHLFNSALEKDDFVDETIDFLPEIDVDLLSQLADLTSNKNVSSKDLSAAEKIIEKPYIDPALQESAALAAKQNSDENLSNANKKKILSIFR